MFIQNTSQGTRRVFAFLSLFAKPHEVLTLQQAGINNEIGCHVLRFMEGEQKGGKKQWRRLDKLIRPQNTHTKNQCSLFVKEYVKVIRDAVILCSLLRGISIQFFFGGPCLPPWRKRVVDIQINYSKIYIKYMNFFFSDLSSLLRGINTQFFFGGPCLPPQEKELQVFK